MLRVFVMLFQLKHNKLITKMPKSGACYRSVIGPLRGNFSRHQYNAYDDRMSFGLGFCCEVRSSPKAGVNNQRL